MKVLGFCDWKKWTEMEIRQNEEKASIMGVEVKVREETSDLKEQFAELSTEESF